MDKEEKDHAAYQPKGYIPGENILSIASSSNDAYRVVIKYPGANRYAVTEISASSLPRMKYLQIRDALKDGKTPPGLTIGAPFRSSSMKNKAPSIK